VAVEIEITMNPKIRRDIAVVAKESTDNMINLIFSRGSVTLLGYSSSVFCLCKEFIDCEVDYNFRVQAGVIMAMSGYAFLKFELTTTTVTLSGLDKDRKMKRSAQVRVNNDTLVNYQADFYNDIIRSLRSGISCQSLMSLKQFYKISRVNQKSERGVVISNKQFYTCGEGFKFYAKTDIDFNCFILSDDLASLIDFVGEGDSILYMQNSFIVAKNTSDCYFGVRTAMPQDGIRDLHVIMEQKPEMQFNIPIQEVKASVRSLKDDKTGLGKIIFQPKEGNVVVGLRDIVFMMPITYKDVEGSMSDKLDLDFKLFNKLLQTLDVDLISTVRVYPRFITMSAGNDSILIIGRS